MPPETVFSTVGLPPADRAGRWSEVISASYFPLDLSFRAPERFSGALAKWRLGDVFVSRLQSDALAYRRRPEHLRDAGEEEFLITVPRVAPVRFTQMGRDVVCPPGGFLLERGNEPYDFSYDARNDLIAVKLGLRTLSSRLPRPGRYCALGFDGRQGVGGLMTDLIRSTEARWSAMSPRARAAVGEQIVDLLALTVEEDARVLESTTSCIRAAHLSRITNHIERNLFDPELRPATIAAACGVSIRYLHELCSADGSTVRERLQEARLQAARQALSRQADARSITQIAYACGFSDGSQFSRAYRARFGLSPRASRAAARERG